MFWLVTRRLREPSGRNKSPPLPQTEAWFCTTVYHSYYTRKMQRTLHTSDPTRRSYLFHYASFVSSASVTVDIFFPALLWFLSATSWTRYWFMCFFALFIPDCVEYIGVDLIVYICCTVFFCFFFVIDVDNKRPICHSHTVLQKQTSETLPSLETVAPQNAAKSIRRPPDLSDDTLMNWTELLCSNWSSFNEVQKRLQPTWTSPTLTLFKWHLYFLLCVNLVRVYSDVFFCFFFCRTHSGYSCLSIDSDWPLYFRH